MGENTRCISNRCICSAPAYIPGPKDGCISQYNNVTFGNTCYDSVECFYNMQCDVNKCSCGYGRQSSDGGYKCATTELGDSCTYAEDCGTPNAICQDKKCTCGPDGKVGTFSTPEGQTMATCTPKDSTPLNEGEPCNPNDYNRVCGPSHICGPCGVNDFRCLRESLYSYCHQVSIINCIFLQQTAKSAYQPSYVIASAPPALSPATSFVVVGITAALLALL